MEGITTACVAFVFVCILFPRLVRHRPQFYAGFAFILLIILFNTLALIIRAEGFARFVAVVNGMLLLMTLVMLVLSTGGLSLGEWATDVRGAFEVIRRGETEKEIIIPRKGQPPVEDREIPIPPEVVRKPVIRKADEGNIPLE